MKIDHIGYAVKRIGLAIQSFEKLGFVFETSIDDSERNIKIAFGEKDGYRIELVCPLDKKLKSPVDTYLSDIGPTPYHICYRSENFDTDKSDLERKGFKTIIAPSSAAAFGGKRVVFMMDLGFGLMEIVET